MMARRRFESIVVYLDDFLIVEETFERCQEAYLTLISLLIQLGFVISWHKLLALPSWGIVNTSTCMLYVEDHKVKKLYDNFVVFKARKRANNRQPLWEGDFFSGRFWMS